MSLMTDKFEYEGLQIEARFLQSKSESNDEDGKYSCLIEFSQIVEKKHRKIVLASPNQVKTLKNRTTHSCYRLAGRFRDC